MKYAHATEVQTLLFDADLFSAKSAKAWAKSHGFRYGAVDEGGPSARFVRLRQRDPSEYQPWTLRTISLDEDETIKAVVGVPLRAVAATRPASYDSRGPRKNPRPSAAVRAAGQGVWGEGDHLSDGSRVEFRSPGDFRGWMIGTVAGSSNDEHGLWITVKCGADEFEVPHPWVRPQRAGKPRPRSNPASGVGRSVVVPGLGTGTVVAKRPGGMVDVRLTSGPRSGLVVRKPLSSLRPA